MMMQACLIFACLLAVQSFQLPVTRSAALKTASSFSSISPASSRVHRSSDLQMNVFGDAMRFFSNMNKEASAKHILITGNDAVSKLNVIKAELTSAEDLSTAFSELASKVSECPSAKRGGNLGTFKPGMMVREFDEICFEKEVGVVHGPVETQFGAHLIYITRRYEGEEKK
jgi:peptidyl-prolyl cis-trans isomerase C